MSLQVFAFADSVDPSKAYTFPVPSSRTDTISNFLLTPRSSLDYFMEQSKEGHFDKASEVLHTALMDKDVDAEELAWQLWTVINNQFMFKWDDIPDLPEAPPKGQADQSEKWSRSVALDTIELDGRRVTVYLQRFMLDDQKRAVWLISPQSVTHIPALYERYQPSKYQKKIPDWATKRYGVLPIWQWIALPMLVILSYGIAIFMARMLVSISLKITSRWVNLIVPKLIRPFRFLVTIVMLKILTDLVLSLTGPILTMTESFWSVAIVLNVFWFFLNIFNVCFDKLQDRYVRDIHGNRRQVDTLVELRDKSHLTHISVMRRFVIFCAVLITLIILLINFNMFDGVGAGLLTSAGILSVVIGIAGQATIGNIIAGLQIVMTKPVRIGDALSYDGNWCYCEDITYTYITLKVWDDRRIIVPLKEFISKPFENWSMEDAHMLRPVFLYVDPTMNIQVIREYFETLLQNHVLYDGRFRPSVQAFSLSETALCVRLVCSARNPLEAWDLHCEIRESMISFLANYENGRYLPKQRELNFKEPSLVEVS